MAKTFWTFNFLQIAATTVLKLAILGLYRRTFVTRSFHRAINVVTAIILADSLGLLIAESLYCVPAAHFWDPSIPGKCINRVIYLTLASTSLLATDLILYLMPLPVIWKLHMTARRKFQLTFVFILGGLYILLPMMASRGQESRELMQEIAHASPVCCRSSPHPVSTSTT